MTTLCEKCNNKLAEHELEITLIKICTRCYQKILISRIKTQLKKIPYNSKIIMHELSYNFFDKDTALLIFNNIISIYNERNYSIDDNNEDNEQKESIKVMLATKEVGAMLLIEYLSNENNKNANDNNEDDRKKTLIGIGNNSIILPLIQLSVNELNLLINDKINDIKLTLNEKYTPIHDMLLDIEKTHKDASSGLSKSLIQISEYISRN